MVITTSQPRVTTDSKKNAATVATIHTEVKGATRVLDCDITVPGRNFDARAHNGWNQHEAAGAVIAFSTERQRHTDRGRETQKETERETEKMRQGKRDKGVSWRELSALAIYHM